MSIAVGLAIAAMPILASPLGGLGPPFALLVVLPALALALEAFGWSTELASLLRRVADPTRRLLVAYALWLGVSAVLSLDTAATAGATVGIEAAGEDVAARRQHVGAAILGSNVGSLLFPFSNLTNLVLLGATGVGLVPFVAATWLPQLGAALAVGLVLSRRLRPSADTDLEPEADVLMEEVVHPHSKGSGTTSRAEGPAEGSTEGTPVELPGTRPIPLAGLTALAGSVGAVAFGVAGLDMAVPFAITGGTLVAAALMSARVTPREVVRTLPWSALAFVAAAAVLSGPATILAHDLPRPTTGLVGLAVAVLVGGLLAISINNLPAAAIGGVWLAHADLSLVVAYLIGTNIVAVATPHGSAATMLARSVGARRGVVLAWMTYVRGAWRYGVVGSVTALLLVVASARP